MARPFTPKVLTANRLILGDVVYLAADGEWVTQLKDAMLIEDETKANEQLAIAAANPSELVGAYLADALIADGHPAPAHFREDFRARGPSNYPHGKQTGA